MCLTVLAVLAALVTTAAASQLPDEKWAYVDVRPGAHMFWWFQGRTEADRDSSPTVIWLQGGPGASSTGYGNFEEIGPLTVAQEPRATTWLSRANLIYIDNPVGTGYSYVDDLGLLTTNNTQIAADLVTCLQNIVATMPQVGKTPLYVFSESYGGKMNTGFAGALLTAIDNGNIAVDFRGIALDDSWIDGLAYVEAWGPYLYQNSQLDANGLAAVNASAQKVADAVAAGQWAQATNLWGDCENVITYHTDSVSFYNILYHHGDSAVAKQSLAARHLHAFHADSLTTLMNGPVRQKLGIIPDNVTWGGQSGDVFNSLSTDFMKPVYDDVSALLEGGKIDVNVVNAQLDLICCTPGTEMWMSKMGWGGMGEFYAAKRYPLYNSVGDFDTTAFYKQAKGSRLAMYYVNRAGHMAPADNGPGMLRVLERVVKKAAE